MIVNLTDVTLGDLITVNSNISVILSVFVFALLIALTIVSVFIKK